MKRWLVVIVAIVGCKKDAAPPGECAAAAKPLVDRLLKSSMEEGAAEHGEVNPAVRGELDRLQKDMGPMAKALADAIAKACTDDGWSADAVACVKAAKDATSLSACDSKLSADQRKHVEAAITDAMKKSAPTGSPTCKKYADLEIKCNAAGEDARPVILDFCEKARGGAKGSTYQLIALESSCAETVADCDGYKACVEKKKSETTPEP